jgi:hypothetical protein
MGCPCGRTIVADTLRGFRYKASVPNTDKLTDFVAWCGKHITGNKKGQAQIFRDRLLQAFGQPDCLGVGAAAKPSQLVHLIVLYTLAVSL